MSSSSSGTQSTEAVDAVIKLSYKEKVPVVAMKEILTYCLQEKLAPMQIYDGEKCNEAAKALSDTIKNRLKLLGYDRYKYVVQVLIGERREQGDTVRQRTKLHPPHHALRHSSQACTLALAASGTLIQTTMLPITSSMSVAMHAVSDAL